ncbi:MAG: DUF547 domain-containing protein [Chloroflexales bacterium]|nr:DUF547 domain-containing protein [Chloroflexales bacterium]
MNELINLREAALRLIVGERAGEALNAGVAPLPPHDPALPEALAAALRELKLAAVSDDGLRADYAALAASAAYGRYRAEVAPRLAGFDPGALATRAARLAFWINLYNTLVLDAVVTYQVRRSVADQLGGLAFFRRAGYVVGGQRFSLEAIEHGVLRANAGNPFIPGPQFAAGDPRLALGISPRDPRLHFALNCASRSCPPIAAYDAARVEAQLDMAARSFVGADAEIAAGSDTLRLSAIFSWYREDFGGYDGVVSFVRAHLPDDERRRWLEARREIDLEFKPYDWGLNSR